jgi:hypothetical protein
MKQWLNIKADVLKSLASLHTVLIGAFESWKLKAQYPKKKIGILYVGLWAIAPKSDST